MESLVDPFGAPLQPLEGRADFAAGVRWLLAHAAASGVQEMRWVSPDFADWPLGNAEVLGRLAAWARGPQRKLLLIAQHYEAVPRRHPRFVQWRRLWAHRTQCRAVGELDASQVPTLLLAGDLGLQVMDTQRWRGRWLTDANDLRTWEEVTEALLQRSEEAFGANTLGL